MRTDEFGKAPDLGCEKVMMEGTLTQAAESMHGILSGSDRPFRGVSTDTRTLRAGELFFALQGPNFDGNRFVAKAALQQAAGAVVTRDSDSDLPSIAVADTRIALGQLAAAWRHRNSATVIGRSSSVRTSPSLATIGSVWLTKSKSI